MFDVNRSWKMLRQKKKAVQGENVALSGFKGMNRNDAARLAAAAGVRLSADFSVEQAVANFGVMKLREMYAGQKTEEAFSRFDVLERRVDFAEGRADAAGLGVEKTLDEEISELRSADKVDAELEDMKARARARLTDQEG